MVLAEVRYFGWVTLFMAAIFIPLFGTASLAREAHLSTALGFAIYCVFEIVLFVATFAVWLARELRKPDRSSATYPQARYAPIILDVLLALFIAYQVVGSFISYRTTGRLPADVFLLVPLIVLIVFERLQVWRRRFAHKPPELPD